MNQLVPIRGGGAVAKSRRNVVVPAAIAGAGEHATQRFLEFFAATIRNRNTREAYYRACCRFLAWCERHDICELPDIEPLHVAAYVEALGPDFEKPTVKQHLAAIRMLFDWLVTGGVLAVNPATSVRGPKHVVKRGKTPVLTTDQARALDREHRYFDPRGLARPGAHRRHDLRLRPHRRRRLHAGRGLFRQRQALVGPPPRERRQAPRDAGAAAATGCYESAVSGYGDELVH